MNSNGEFKQYLKALALDESSGQGLCAAHPDEQTLIDFHQGRLRADARWEARLHLEMCAQCGERLIDVEDFLDPARAGETELSEFEIKRQWRALVGKLTFAHRAQGLNRQASHWSAARQRLPSRTVLALAAGLIITLSSSVILSVKLWQEMRARQIDSKQITAAAHIGLPITTPVSRTAKVNKSANAPVPFAANSFPQPQANTPVFNMHLTKLAPSSDLVKEPYFAGVPANAAFFIISVIFDEDAYPTYALKFTAPDGSPHLAARRVTTQ